MATLAAARGVDPGDLLAELVLQAETAQVVAEVNDELERLTQGPSGRQRRQAEVDELEATVAAWMKT